MTPDTKPKARVWLLHEEGQWYGGDEIPKDKRADFGIKYETFAIEDIRPLIEALKFYANCNHINDTLGDYAGRDKARYENGITARTVLAALPPELLASEGADE